MGRIYATALWIYALMLVLASPFSSRARRWRQGRIRQSIPELGKPAGCRRIWFHVSSLGEYEQGRPLIEAWRKEHPEDEILLSFFSPSGYDSFRDHHLADLCFYLPLDHRRRSRRLVEQLKPTHFVLVKYDFWPNLMESLLGYGVRCYLVSAIFSRNHFLFRPWTRWILELLKRFDHLFVQDEASRELLVSKGFQRVTVTGDTRVDRVSGLVKSDERDRKAEKGWTPAELVREVKRVWGDDPILVGGSTWQPEERILQQLFADEGEAAPARQWRLILAPHDLSAKHLADIQKMFRGNLSTLSAWEKDSGGVDPGVRVLLVDRIGLLSGLYRAADLALVGGGFGNGIHNILEPASHGVATLFGKRHARFREAVELIAIQAAFSAADERGLVQILEKLMGDPEMRRGAGLRAATWIQREIGATGLIMSVLE